MDFGFLHKLLSAIALLLLTVACADGTTPLGDATLDISIDDGLRADTVEFFVIEPDYCSARSMGSWLKSTGEPCRFATQLDGERLAFLTFGRDSRPFYFVMHPGHISLTIKGDRWEVSGSAVNARLANIVTQAGNDKRKRLDIAHQYIAAIADTSLTADADSTLWRRDSLLSDTLRHIHLMADTSCVPLWRAARFHLENLRR